MNIIGRASVGHLRRHLRKTHIYVRKVQQVALKTILTVFYKVLLIYLGNASFIISATELATKKARLKQKLIRSAKSVGLFSLKLKERRQREAQKAANIAVEHVKVRLYFVLLKHLEHFAKG